jgi:hypothetical protein
LLGKCEQAIVDGTNINLQPFTNHIYQTVKFNSADGKSKVWDEEALPVFSFSSSQRLNVFMQLFCIREQILMDIRKWELSFHLLNVKEISY